MFAAEQEKNRFMLSKLAEQQAAENEKQRKHESEMIRECPIQ